ncbi:MAG: ParB/RepB/Spo0J family partition protein [Candidatus Sumerlaeia bacterium]|nr:ParB/RepB/Spo0J family partition protein [Candidatus Sumerlaeia bacterium]
MTALRRQALGKGLDALLGRPVVTASLDTPEPIASVQAEDASHARLLHVPVSDLKPNRHQPRQDFDREGLEELAASVKHSGMIQPIVVRRSEGGYEIIAGERRWRAAKIACLSSVPCIESEATDRDSLLLALLENVQRENLNPIEEAEAYAALREEFRFTQEEIAERMGKSRAAVANILRLLTLPPEMKEDVRDGAISAGHARALLGVLDPDRRRQLWREIRERGLSVREAEEWSRAGVPGKSRQTSAFTGRPRGSPADAEVASLVERLEGRLGLRVAIRRRGAERGRVELHYGSAEEFERIMQALGLPASARL